MTHPSYRVHWFERVGPFVLRVGFDDETERTLVWPNGAVFASATLHDWPEQVGARAARARTWTSVQNDPTNAKDNQRHVKQ